MAGKRLNVVGELDESVPIPAAEFKSVIGGDLLTGRHPNFRPFTFRNTATHVFTSNHVIPTKDRSPAFYARWLPIHFPNSRLALGLPLDPHLADQIIEEEMAQIASWALEGAARVIEQGKFSPSKTGDEVLRVWRMKASSIDSFIDDCCELGDDHHMRRADFYRNYQAWCQDNGRKTFSKSSVKDHIERNIALKCRMTVLNGYEVIRGLRLKDSALDQIDL